MTEVETARALYDRIRRDSRGMAPYRVVHFIARMMNRDPFAVLNAIGVERISADDEASFICPRCGAVSHNPHDVEQRYCGRCHVFVDDPTPVSDRSDTRSDTR